MLMETNKDFLKGGKFPYNEFVCLKTMWGR